MRKIKELTADEFFDFTLALTPVIPLILDMEIVKMQYMGVFNAEVRRQQNIIRSEREKAANAPGDKVVFENAAKVSAAFDAIGEETGKIMVRDISALVPKLLTRENREAIFEALTILFAGEINYTVLVKPEVAKMVKNKETGELEKVVEQKAEYETIPVESVKSIPGHAIVGILRAVIADVDMNGFLPYAEPSDVTE